MNVKQSYPGIEVLRGLTLTGHRILVTGGAGFIGSNLGDALLGLGNHVTCYDNFSPYYEGKDANIQHQLANPRYRLVRADILDHERLEDAAQDIDTIFHLGAQPGVRYSLENPTAVMRVNVEGTVSVLEAARKRGAAKVVFASSSSVYGNPDRLPVVETDPTNPVSPYGASKLAAEKVCQAYSELYGMRIVALRYFTVYGPRQRPDMAVRRFLKELLDNRPITVFGDGKQTRDTTYVHDIVTGTIAAAATSLRAYEILNLGAGHRVTVLDLLRTLAEVAGRQSSMRYRFEPRNAADVSDTHADIEKARKLVRFEPQTTLQEGLKTFVDWYSSTQ